METYSPSSNQKGFKIQGASIFIWSLTIKKFKNIIFLFRKENLFILAVLKRLSINIHPDIICIWILRFFYCYSENLTIFTTFSDFISHRHLRHISTAKEQHGLFPFLFVIKVHSVINLIHSERKKFLGQLYLAASLLGCIPDSPSTQCQVAILPNRW